MLTEYKGRNLRPGQKVQIYFNLHKKLFSIMDLASGLIIAHGSGFILNNVTFVVSEAGRNKVLDTGHKNVHAFAVGTFCAETSDPPSAHSVEVTYNPFKAHYFYVKETFEPVDEAKSIKCYNNKLYARL